MRAVLVLVATAACNFSVTADEPATGNPESPVDALPGVVADAPEIDAPTTTAPSVCSVRTASTTGTNRGQVGGNGGSAGTTLACNNAADRIVGVAVRMSNQATANGGRSAVAFLIQCATVTVVDAQATVGTPYVKEVAGAGTFDWTPATLSPTTSCQPGWVVSGIHAYRGSSDNLFVNVTIQCSEVTSTGQLGQSELIYVTGSLTDTQNADNVDCAAGEVLVRLPTRTGAGLDAVSLSCSTPTCN